MERKQRRMKRELIRRRVMAVFLCFALALSFLVGVVGLSGSVFAASGDEAYTSVDQLPENAMHFIVRHWHTLEADSYSKFQGTEGNAAGGVAGTDVTNERLFVVQEGYIVPCNEKNSHGKNYHFYFVYQGDFKGTDLMGDDVDREEGQIDLIDEYYTKLEYVPTLDFTTGTITFNIIPVTDEENEARNERFSGLSVSAGQGAVDTANKTGDDTSSGYASFTIEYKSDIHLAKVHVFYIYEGITVPGTNNGAVFENTNGEQTNKEEDTAYVYAYADDDGEHAAGDLVMDSSGNPIRTDVPNAGSILAGLGLNADNLDKVKIYSTLEGLHTDKTAYDLKHDGRTYDLELEAWYSGAVAANVGLVLDASGSMAFTSDTPEIINVLTTLGITRSGDDFFDSQGNKIGTGHSYNSIIQKLLALEKVNKANRDLDLYPQKSNLIGYYAFNKVAYGGKTYVLDAAVLNELGQTTFAQGGSLYNVGDEGFFTITTKNSRDASVSKKTISSFESDADYTGDYYITLGGTPDDITSNERGSISFTIESTATVKIWWNPGGNNRQVRILNASKSVVFTSNVDGGSSSSDKGYLSEVTLDPGKYYLVGWDGSSYQNNNIYKVEVYVEPGTVTKTHTLESKKLTVQEYTGTTLEDDNEHAGENYFTINWGNSGKVDGSGNTTWNDSYSSSQRINFGGSASTGDRNIQFTTEGAATVQIWWRLGGSSDRNVVILNESGGTAAGPTTDGKASDYNTDNNIYISTLTLNSAGTYYLGSNTSNIWIYKVVVSEEVIVEDNSFINSVDLTNTAPGKTDSGDFLDRQGDLDFDFDTTRKTLEEDKKADATDLGLNLKGLENAVKLDAVPSGNFTISFSITTTGDPTIRNPLDILYIGSATDDDGDVDYLRAKRGIDNRSNLNIYKNGEQEKSGGASMIGNNKHYITLVYENFTLTAYSYNAGSTIGEATAAFTISDLHLPSDPYIVINGFNSNSSYDGDDIYIDDVFVYNAALTASEVQKLCQTIKTQTTGNVLTADFDAAETSTTTIDWENDIFLSLDEVGFFLNPHNTDNSPLSSSDYTYYVYDPRNDLTGTSPSSTMEYTPLGYWDGVSKDVKSTVGANYDNAKDAEGNIIGGLINPDGAGWYYASYVSRWSDTYINPNVQTAKTLRGIQGSTSGGRTFTDTIETGDTTRAEPGVGADPDKQGDNSGNSNAQCTITSDSTVKFYIDCNGNLRCFFDSADSNYYTSYVFKKADGDPTKVEALQRALGAFTTMLEESSPESMVSAVRFSMDTSKHYYSMRGTWNQYNSDGTLKDKKDQTRWNEDRYIRYKETAQESERPDDLDKLVLLDWTNNSGVSANILSLEWGMEPGENVGGTVKGTNSDNGITQYNYALTGGTFTWTGLQAFKDSLADSNDDVNNADKYLIIFTDGLDDEINYYYNSGNSSNYKYPTNADGTVNWEGTWTQVATQSKLQACIEASMAKKLADELKDMGYTIYTVMLTGGPVNYVSPDTEGYEATQYGMAKEFLLALSGTSDENEDKEQYFYATDPDELAAKKKAQGDDDEDGNVAEAIGNTKVDMLIEIFANDILGQIIESLNNYRVDDYIDPRFDLQAGIADATDANNIKTSKDEYVIRLNEGGRIQIVKTDGFGDMSKDKVYATFNLQTGETWLSNEIPDDFDWKLGGTTTHYLTLNLSDRSAVNTRNPRLYYDSTNDMYYLSWRNQAIPGCTIGASKLNIWSSRITVRAKDDFIGGNALLSNGQAASMNWVYYASDSDRSSGTDDMYKANNDEYPSKGFPRTTLNVALLDLTMKSGEQILYLGEKITPAKLAEELSYTVNYEYYWGDYLDRYIKLCNSKTSIPQYTSVEDFFAALMQNSNNTVMLPYYYLTHQNNQAGNLNAQQSDQIGYLVYTWELIDPETELAIDPDGYGTGLGPKQGTAYVTQDTRDVVYRLTVTYYPFPDPDDPLWDDWSGLEDDLTTVSGLSSKLSAVKAKLDEVKAFEHRLSELALSEQPEEDEVDLAELKTALETSLNELKTSLDALTSYLPTLETAISTLLENENLPADMKETLSGLKDQREALNSAAGALNTALTLTDAEDFSDLLTALNGLLTGTALTGYETNAETCFSLAAEYKRSYDYLLWCVGEDSTTHSDELTTRDDENEKLIKETAYGPNSSGHYPKTAVGAPVYDKTVNGTYTTRIVRGELAFELDFDFTELQIAAGFWTDGRATFTLDVARDGDLDGFTTPIPDKMTITITRQDLEELENAEFKINDDDRYVKILYYQDELGNDTPYPKAIYTMDTGIVSFFSDPRQWDTLNESGYVTSIPYGDYTISVPDRTTDDTNAIWDYFTLGDLTYVELAEYERDDHHFTDFTPSTNARDSVYVPSIVGEDKNEPNPNYYAPELDGPETHAQQLRFGLGHTSTGTGVIYLTERVGMVKLTPHLKYLLPATGGEGTQGLMAAGTILIAAALGILVTERLLKQRRRRFER